MQTPEQLEKNRAKSKKWREKHRASLTDEQRVEERERIAAYHKDYRAKNAELVKAKKAAYSATPEGRELRRLASERLHRRRGMMPRQKLPADIALERVRASWRKYGKTHAHVRRARYAVRYKTDVPYKLIMNLRKRVRDFLSGRVKSKKTKQLLGCTMEELKVHLEKQFKPGMSWENYGHSGWSVDHVQACSLFNMNDSAQQAKCFHYTNLAPLWRVENIIKGNTLPPGVPHPQTPVLNPPCVPPLPATTVRT